jgi:hypothetical protein
VAQIVSPGDAPEVKLRKIYDRVQQIRNKSYELRKTEQEEKRDKEKLVENVEELWKRGYGNGVQLTWLYLGLVRAAGFEAYGCWVSKSAAVFLQPEYYGAWEAECQRRDLYFDPGAEFAPFGLLEWSETG